MAGYGIPWSDDEDERLKRVVAQGLSSKAAVPQFPGRSSDAIRRHARDIGHRFKPTRVSPKGRKYNEGGAARGPWETRLFEPWAEYTARMKAERAAKKAQGESA